MKIQLDMYQTIAAAVLVLMLGKYLKRKCSILEKFCIPGAGRWWFAFCNPDLRTIWNRNRRSFL